MDEYLSEKEQIEQIKQWWSENGWYLVGGALLAVLGYLGYNQFGAYQDRNAAEAAAIKSELELALADDDRESADSLLARLTADHPDSPYTSQARFMLADGYLVRDTRRAIAELAAVVEEADDPELANIARSRLARALAYDEQYDRALEALDVEDSGAFAARFSEIRGDIYVARGDREAAQSAYTQAIVSAGSEFLNLELLQLKLGDLLPADELPAAEPPAAGSASGESVTGESVTDPADAAAISGVETGAGAGAAEPISDSEPAVADEASEEAGDDAGAGAEANE